MTVGSSRSKACSLMSPVASSIESVSLLFFDGISWLPVLGAVDLYLLVADLSRRCSPANCRPVSPRDWSSRYVWEVSA